MKVLITGGRGFIGHYVCRKFEAEGHEVRVLTNLSHPSKITEGREFIYGDVRYSYDVERAVRDVDCVIHLAAKIHVDRSREFSRPYFDTNILGTYNVLEACRKYKKKMLHASTSEALGSYKPHPMDLGMSETWHHQPENPYGTTKAAADMLCTGWRNSYDVDVTILRSFNVSGVGQSHDKEGAFIPRVIQWVLKGENPKIFGGGDQTRDYIWVGDVAEAYYLLARGDYKGQVYHVGTGREVSINHVAQTLIDISGKDLQIEYIGERPKELRRLKCDASKMRSLGWRPTKPIEQVLREMYEAELAGRVGVTGIEKQVHEHLCPWVDIYHCELENGMAG